MIGDSGQWTTAPQLHWVQYWGLKDAEGERMVLLVKYTRRCLREGEGSVEKASIYMILVPTLAPCTTPPTTPPRTTVTLFPTKAELL